MTLGPPFSYLTADKVVDKLGVGCRAILLVAMDKGGRFDGDHRPGEQTIDTQVLLRAAENLRTEQKLHKCYSNHHVHFVCDGAGLVVCRSVGCIREHALLIFFQFH